MNRQDIIRMAKNSGLFVELVLERDLDWLERFAALVASAERERIKQANAPEIERINAHIKELEDAVLVEREACAKVAEQVGQHKNHIGIAAAIRARGQA